MPKRSSAAGDDAAFNAQKIPKLEEEKATEASSNACVNEVSTVPDLVFQRPGQKLEEPKVEDEEEDSVESRFNGDLVPDKEDRQPTRRSHRYLHKNRSGQKLEEPKVEGEEDDSAESRFDGNSVPAKEDRQPSLKHKLFDHLDRMKDQSRMDVLDAKKKAAEAERLIKETKVKILSFRGDGMSRQYRKALEKRKQQIREELGITEQNSDDEEEVM